MSNIEELVRTISRVEAQVEAATTLSDLERNFAYGESLRVAVENSRDQLSWRGHLELVTRVAEVGRKLSQMHI